MVENITHYLQQLAGKYPQYGRGARIAEGMIRQLGDEGLLPEYFESEWALPETKIGEIYEHPHFTFDPNSLTLRRFGEEAERTVTSVENGLLRALIARPNTAIHWHVLREAMSLDPASSSYASSDNLAQRILNLRKLMGWQGDEYTDPRHSPIRTVKGVGYELRDESRLPQANGGVAQVRRK